MIPVDNSMPLSRSDPESGMSLDDMAHERLLRALTRERYDNRWWKTAPAPTATDDEVTCARRRRAMAADFAALDNPERRAT